MKIGRMTKLTLFSTLFSLILRGISLMFNVYLTNEMGAQGIGLMSIIGSVYGLGVTFSASGYRLATTRLAVEDEASEDPNPKRLMRYIIGLAILTGTLCGAILFLSSDFISVRILTEPRCRGALKILSATLPMMAVSGVISAYLNSFYKIVKVASLQAVTQLVQIAYVAVCLPLYGTNIEACCIQIAQGSLCGEAVTLCVAAVMLRGEIVKKQNTGSKKPLWKPFIRIALPDALGYDLRSGLSTIQHMLIPIGLKKSGSSSAVALSTYGVLHGMALQVVLFPSCILRSLATLLVPAITESRSRNNSEATKATVRRVIHMTLVFSVGVASVMFFASDNIAFTLYKNYDCAGFLRLLSPLVPIMYLDISVDSMLKGLDEQISSMGFNLLDSFVSVILVWLLIPRFAVNGYIITVFVTECLNTFLSLHKLVSVSRVKLNLLSDLLLPLTCAVGGGCIGQLSLSLLANAYNGFTLTIQILINAIGYFLLITASSAETRENLSNMLKIKEKSHKTSAAAISFNK